MNLSARINRGIVDKLTNDIFFLVLPIMEALILPLKMSVYYSLSVHKRRINFQSNNKKIHSHQPDNPYHFFRHQSGINTPMAVATLALKERMKRPVNRIIGVKWKKKKMESEERKGNKIFQLIFRMRRRGHNRSKIFQILTILTIYWSFLSNVLRTPSFLKRIHKFFSILR